MKTHKCKKSFLCSCEVSKLADEVSDKLINVIKQQLNQGKMSSTYILVEFPEVQEYMEEDWFEEEAVLANDEEQFGSSAYMIPQERVLTTREQIITKVEELAKIFPTTEEDFDSIEREWEQGIPFEGGMSIGEHIIDIKRLL